MFKCDLCNKEFKSQRGLNAHQVSHKEGPRYSSRPKKEKQTFSCKNCGTLSEITAQTTNQFCSSKCSGEYQRKETNRLIEDGHVFSFETMRRYLMETDGTCQECGIGDTYNGKPITLQCDHIDGDNDNHSLNNLRVLCPNCHSQTDTWCGRNKKDTKRNKYLREYKAELAQR